MKKMLTLASKSLMEVADSIKRLCETGWSVHGVSALAVLLLVGAGSLYGEDLRRTWTGTGADVLASNPDNWLDGILPTNVNSIVFDDTGTTDCTWDLDIVVSNGHRPLITKGR